MIFLPRIARTLHHPALAVLLGFVLVAIAIYGLVSGNIPRLWSIIILVVGALNVLRAVPREQSDGSPKPVEGVQATATSH
jgi:hypothetical protein